MLLPLLLLLLLLDHLLHLLHLYLLLLYLPLQRLLLAHKQRVLYGLQELLLRQPSLGLQWLVLVQQ